MAAEPKGPPSAIPALCGATLALLVAAVAVRGTRGPAPIRAPESTPLTRKLVEPMQFLGARSGVRIDELLELIEPTKRSEFLACSHLPFDLAGCPRLTTWIDGPDGQRFERMLVALRQGGNTEAFAALAVLFQLGRSTQWKTPRLSSGSADAERYGELLRDWLAAWGEASARDELLREPAQAAFLVYGRVMRTAYEAAWVGHKEGPHARAKQFALDLTGADQPRHTEFGQELQRAFPEAFDSLVGRDDFFAGASKQAKTSHPEIDGECGK